MKLIINYKELNHKTNYSRFDIMGSKFEKYKKLGDQELKAGEYKKALDYFNRAINIEPKNAEGWTRKAAAEIYLRDYSNALESSDEAIRLDRKSADAWFNRGLVLDKRRNFDEALVNYDKVIRFNPRHVKALNNKGTVLGQLERWDEAKQCFEQALKYDPKNEDAKENLKLLSDYKAGKHKSRCFIATAAYGTPLATELKFLRSWRDNKLKLSRNGERFIFVYYKISPTIANFISRFEILRAMVRSCLRILIRYLVKRNA